MRVLIYGCNQLTAALVPELVGEGVEITVIGESRDCLAKLIPYLGVRVLHAAEPKMQDYLQEGGVGHANVFLALSDNDHENLLTAQIARKLFNVSKVLCHLGDPKLQVFYSTLGINVVGQSFGFLQDIHSAIQG